MHYKGEIQMASENVLTFTDANFDRDVLQSDIPVLVDFWATWCAPCKAIAPLIDTVAAEYAGKIKVGKVNVDENQATPGKYGVRGIPTIVLFKSGAVLDQIVGAVPKSQLDALIAKAL
jgi:thioredoxin 1